MFRVTVDEYSSAGLIRHLDLVITKLKLFELIGRYTLKYGPCDQVIAEEGLTEYEFYKAGENGFTAAQVCFGMCSNDAKSKDLLAKPPNVTSIKKEPVVEVEPEERIKALVDAGVLKKAY